MKNLSEFILSRLGIGVLVVAPIYLAVLLLLKAMKSLTGVVRPLAKLLPKWLPADHVFSLLLVMIICFVIGVTVRTRIGRATWERMENFLLKENPWLRSCSRFYSAIGWRDPRSIMEAGAGRD